MFFLTVNGGNGNDTINASSLPADVIGLTIDGGAGNDTLIARGPAGHFLRALFAGRFRSW
jgi:Ca2+-binding RTX toxin-like protein